MRRLLLLTLLSISLCTWAQSPVSRRYTALVETPRAAISGICILAGDSTELRGSLFNEFGITALEFTWLRKRDKVRLHSVMPALDKWYIRRTLRRDLRHLLLRLEQGEGSYENTRHHIKYTLIPIQ